MSVKFIGATLTGTAVGCCSDGFSAGVSVGLLSCSVVSFCPSAIVPLPCVAASLVGTAAACCSSVTDSSIDCCGSLSFSLSVREPKHPNKNKIANNPHSPFFFPFLSTFCFPFGFALFFPLFTLIYLHCHFFMRTANKILCAFQHPCSVLQVNVKEKISRIRAVPFE